MPPAMAGGHKLEPWAQQNILLFLQAASGAEAELKVVTVKALRALAPGNPAVPGALFHSSGAGRNGNVLGMLVGVEQVRVCSPALLLSSWNTAGRVLSFGHLDIVSHGYSGKCKLKYPGGSQSYNLLGTFHISKMRVIPCKKPCQGLVWAGRSLEETLGHSAGDRLGTETIPEGCWSSSQLYSKPPTKGMAQPARTAYSSTYLCWILGTCSLKSDL